MNQKEQAISHSLSSIAEAEPINESVNVNMEDNVFFHCLQGYCRYYVYVHTLPERRVRIIRPIRGVASHIFLSRGYSPENVAYLVSLYGGGIKGIGHVLELDSPVCKLLRMRRICHFRWAPKSLTFFSASGDLDPRPPAAGCAPDPRGSLALRVRQMCPDDIFGPDDVYETDHQGKGTVQGATKSIPLIICLHNFKQSLEVLPAYFVVPFANKVIIII